MLQAVRQPVQFGAQPGHFGGGHSGGVEEFAGDAGRPLAQGRALLGRLDEHGAFVGGRTDAAYEAGAFEPFQEGDRVP